jgi:hypothetical protein
MGSPGDPAVNGGDAIYELAHYFCHRKGAEGRHEHRPPIECMRAHCETGEWAVRVTSGQWRRCDFSARLVHLQLKFFPLPKNEMVQLRNARPAAVRNTTDGQYDHIDVSTLVLLGRGTRRTGRGRMQPFSLFCPCRFYGQNILAHPRNIFHKSAPRGRHRNTSAFAQRVAPSDDQAWHVRMALAATSAISQLRHATSIKCEAGQSGCSNIF